MSINASVRHNGYCSVSMVLVFVFFALLSMSVVAKAEKGKDAPLMSAVNPFRIDITAEDEAWLMNVSTSTQYVFIDSLRQPARPRLFDASGNEMEIIDERAREKYDNMIHGKESFVPLLSGQHLLLLRIEQHREAGYIELRAGPYRLALRPGKYIAMVEWASERDDYLDESGYPKRNKDVWLGKVRSSKFELNVR